jgi:hypothetical protein
MRLRPVSLDQPSAAWFVPAPRTMTAENPWLSANSVLNDILAGVAAAQHWDAIRVMPSSSTLGGSLPSLANCVLPQSARNFRTPPWLAHGVPMPSGKGAYGFTEQLTLPGVSRGDLLKNSVRKVGRAMLATQYRHHAARQTGNSGRQERGPYPRRCRVNRAVLQHELNYCSDIHLKRLVLLSLGALDHRCTLNARAKVGHAK